MKMHTRIFTFLLFVAIAFTTSQFIACGEDNTEPAPVTPPEKEEPAKKPNEDKQEEDEGEKSEPCDTNYNITKVTFPIHRNAALSNTVTIYPDENNVFRERVFASQNSDGHSYLMPSNLTKLYIEFESDANAIYINGVEYKSSSAYDFSQPTTITAYADSGTEKSYTIILDNFTGLPIIYINTASGQEVKDKENYEDATIEIVGTDDLPGLTKMNMRIHGRGNVSWTAFKKKQSYTISLDSKQKVLGMPKHKKWVLISNYRDKTLLRNNVAWWISSHLPGIKYTPRFQHAELILNGRHRGVYQVVEQVRIDDDRVDINEMQPTDTEGEAITGGYLIELDRMSDDTDQWRWVLPHLQGGTHQANIKKPKIDESNQAQHDYIKDYLFKVDELLGTSDDMEYVMEKYIDMPSWAAQWLVFELSGTPEPNGPNSWYTYKEKSDDKWYCGPPWDFDYQSFVPSTAKQFRNKSYVYQPQMRKYEPYREELIRQWEAVQPLLPDLINYINEQREYMRYSAEANWYIHEQNLKDDQSNQNGDEYIPSDSAIDRMIEYLYIKWDYVENNIRNLK
ncbi:MAG: CotH kinase family protein [Alistipes sp.]|nr:CotH kinase family protein [Alistipes sp.]